MQNISLSATCNIEKFSFVGFETIFEISFKGTNTRIITDYSINAMEQKLSN